MRAHASVSAGPKDCGLLRAAFKAVVYALVCSSIVLVLAAMISAKQPKLRRKNPMEPLLWADPNQPVTIAGGRCTRERLCGCCVSSHNIYEYIHMLIVRLVSQPRRHSVSPGAPARIRSGAAR